MFSLVSENMRNSFTVDKLIVYSNFIDFSIVIKQAILVNG